MAGGDEPDTARLAAALAPERLAPYRRATGGDLNEAVRLYEWNLAVSDALYEALGILEVVLRNALSTQLAVPLGPRSHRAPMALGERSPRARP